MAQVSDWQTEEEKNTSLDELTLSGEGGLYTNKIMCAVKKKFDEVDGKLDAVAGGLVWRGTKATYADLEAVTDPAVGDMYSVTELGGENYAWNGTAWDGLGTSDANVVHKTGSETVGGEKTFTAAPVYADASTHGVYRARTDIEHGDDAVQAEFHALATTDKNKDTISAFKTTVSGNDTRTTITTTNLQYPKSTGVSLVVWGGPETFYHAFIPEGTSVSLGYSGDLRWKDVYAASGSIITSDERLKSSISSFSDKVLDAWGDVDFVQFQFKESIKEKGQNARIHSGVIAQKIDSAFRENGLDASRYALFCHNEWGAKPEKLDSDGNVISEAVPAGDEYSIRYEEALCIEAAYQRRRADRLEERIDALEAVINGND